MGAKMQRQMQSKQTMSRLARSRTWQTGCAVLMVTTLPLLNGCQSISGSETSRTICRELARDLPTYSVKDTPETLESGARFIEVFYAVCGDGFLI